jgi:hypothetical protein
MQWQWRIILPGAMSCPPTIITSVKGTLPTLCRSVAFSQEQDIRQMVQMQSERTLHHRDYCINWTVLALTERIRKSNLMRSEVTRHSFQTSSRLWHLGGWKFLKNASTHLQNCTQSYSRRPLWGPIHCPVIRCIGKITVLNQAKHHADIWGTYS